jgi:hypothetical protein
VTLRDLRKVVKRTIGVTSNGDDADPSENGKA